MRLQVFDYQCEPHGHSFQAPALPLASYGEFLLQSGAGTSMAYLNAFADPTYKEVDELLARQLGVGIKASKRAELLRNIHGQVACDPGEDDRTFQIGRHPSCPVCSSSSMRAWDAAQPARFVDVDVAPVTHSLWESLTEEEKYLRIGRCIMDART